MILEWIDEPTRKAARSKAKAITDMIGYPEYILEEGSGQLNNKYKDLKVEEGSYFNTTINRNAFLLRVIYIL